MIEEIVFLGEDDLEIAQRRMIGPQLAGESRILRRDGEQEKMVERQHRPQEDGNADQQQLGFRRDVAQRGYRHFDNRFIMRSEEHTSELQSQSNLVCRLLLEKKNTT